MTTLAISTQPLRVGFLTPHNPHDRTSFSGSTFFAARALEQNRNVDLRILGPHSPPRLRDRYLRRQKPDFSLSPCELDSLDAVVGLVATPLLQRLNELRPGLPFLHVTDATPAFLREIYGWRVPADADARETHVASRAARTIYTSHAMARRAPGDLGLANMPMDVIPFGVNLDGLPRNLPRKPVSQRINLLFVGTDWVRKGGDIAVAVLDALQAAGREAQLTIVGQCPRRHRAHPGITYAGFLNKNRPCEARRLSDLYSQAHILLLPSRADCTPMVVAEAMAHGVPIVASDVGGIGDLLGADGTGCLLPEFTTVETWANTIAELMSDTARYMFLSEASFDRARTALTWRSWAEGIVGCLHARHAGVPRVRAA